MAEEQIVVAGTQFEFFRIMRGAHMTMRSLDGQKVVVRLATPEEFLEGQKQSRASLEAQGVDFTDGPPLSTLEEAERMVRPLPSDPWGGGR